MKIALFSRSIYPRSGGSSYVVENFAGNFAADEMIVIGEKDISLVKPQYKRSPSNPAFFYLPSGVSIKGRGARFFDIIRALLFPYILIKSIFIVKKNKCTYVLAVFPEGYYLVLALLTSRILGLPMSAYFHNTYCENRTGWSRRLANLIQTNVFNHADFVFVMSEGMQTLYETNYPTIRKFKPLVHTFNEYPAHLPSPRKPSASEIRFAFTGNFNESNIEATVRLVNVLKSNPSYKLNFYTPVPKILLKLRGIDIQAINYYGYLPEDKYAEALQENDFMILTHGFSGQLSIQEYETIFPTRTIPMLLSGRPIIAHVPPFSFIGAFLRKNKCALVIDSMEGHVILKHVEKFVEDDDMRKDVVANAYTVSQDFYGPNVRNYFTKLISAVRNN